MLKKTQNIYWQSSKTNSTTIPKSGEDEIPIHHPKSAQYLENIHMKLRPCRENENSVLLLF